MQWDKFECEECGRRFAIEQPKNDEVEEPHCPSCGESYCRYLGNVQEPAHQ